ncbi:MAG: hypothetical protein GY847_32060, partial [Proteobacteria bacterium]|nr:hypothetical protein [Pseudomonadota bacterium]
MMTRKTTRNIGWVVWVVSFISLLAIGGCKDNNKSAGCEPGTIDCACIEGDAGSTCDEGLACVDGICQGEDSVG